MSKMTVPFMNLTLQISSMRAEIDHALDSVLAHANFILGKEVADFEAQWAAFCGTSSAVGVGSGTDALLMILRALGIGSGDEVITVANTFIATVEAISFAGAKPVLVDCCLDDYLIDTDAVAGAITPCTKASIPVHLYGQPANMDALAAVARRSGIPIIEDAAQAHGATLKDGRTCGSLGNAAAFSFYPAKNLGTFGDGGAVTTSDEGLAGKVRLLGNLGSSVKYHHEIKGLNSRLDTIHAAVLSKKLRHLTAWNDSRRKAATWYKEALYGCPGVVLPRESPWTGKHVYHLFVIRLLERNRDVVAKRLSSAGISTVVHYPVPIHIQKAYSELGLKRGAFPNSEVSSRSVLSLPMFPEISREQVDYVCEQLRAAIAA
jgi:dTDP-4-amino-4,6-dideoxygalactose transaminase